MIADEFTQLVFHTLAHVRLLGPGNLFDRRYIAWAAARFGADDHALLVEDARLLARLWNADARYDRLHRYCELHRDWAEFTRTASRSLAELGPDEVADPRLLASLRELEGAELLHAALALAAAEFRRVFAELRPELETASVEVREWLTALGLADARVELVWALGLHGRASASGPSEEPRWIAQRAARILVGAPAAWNGCSAARQAVLAAHEHTVLRVGETDYAAQEWAALTELAHSLRDAGSELRAAHRDWLASLELAPLLAACVDRGLVSAAEARALIDAPEERPDRLSAARAAASR